jgi:tryptophan-rich sensory protein
MRMRSYYIIIPLFYAGIAIIGRIFTAEGVTSWYPNILKPSYTPQGSIIGAIWTVIYILTAISLIVFIKKAGGRSVFLPAVGMFILNGLFNASWSYIFFTKHLLRLAFIDALLIWITVLILILLTWPIARLSSILLFPYFLWTSFATFLTYEIYRLN